MKISIVGFVAFCIYLAVGPISQPSYMTLPKYSGLYIDHPIMFIGPLLVLVVTGSMLWFTKISAARGWLV